MNQYKEYCHNCGVAISEPSAFCGGCGTALAKPEPVAAHATAAAQGDVAAQPAHAPVPPEAQRASATQQATAPATQTVTLQGIQPAGTPPSSPTPGMGPADAPPQGATTPAASPPGAPPSGSAPPSGEQSPSSPGNWIPFAAIGAGALLVLGVVTVLLLTLGGSAGKDVKGASATREQALRLLAANGTTTVSRVAPGLFALVTTGKLSAAVPAGWRATAQAAGGATRAEFADPRHPTSTLTIVAEKGGPGNSHARALAARRAVNSKGDVVSSFHSVSFPGGREAWRLTYSAAGATHQTYFFSACNNKVGMVADVAAISAAFQAEQTALQAVAASAEPQC